MAFVENWLKEYLIILKYKFFKYLYAFLKFYILSFNLLLKFYTKLGVN